MFLYLWNCTLYHSLFTFYSVGLICWVSRCWFTWMGWLFELLVYWWKWQWWEIIKKNWGNISLNTRVIFCFCHLEFEARADLFFISLPILHWRRLGSEDESVMQWCMERMLILQGYGHAYSTWSRKGGREAGAPEKPAASLPTFLIMNQCYAVGEYAYCMLKCIGRGGHLFFFLCLFLWSIICIWSGSGINDDCTLELGLGYT